MAPHKPSQASTAAARGLNYESVIPNPKYKLLDQMREVMRLKHYSIRTEQTYVDWVRRYVRFHQMKSREEMYPAEPKMEAFLSQLAVKGNVAVATQNQAFNARGEHRTSNIEHRTSNVQGWALNRGKRGRRRNDA